MLKRALLLLPFLASASLADPLSQDWINRISHLQEYDKRDLSKRPFDLSGAVGLFGLYDSNLFLAPPRDRDGDWAAIGLVEGRLDYSDGSFEALVDLSADFPYYIQHHTAREDNERVFAKVRLATGILDAGITEVFRRESDPIDVQFREHSRWMVSDTAPRVGLRLGSWLLVEANASVRVVRYEGDEFDNRENQSVRAGPSVRVDVMENFGVVAEGGYLLIHYHDRNDGGAARRRGVVRAGRCPGIPVQRARRRSGDGLHLCAL